MTASGTGVGTVSTDGSWVYESGMVRRLPGDGVATAIGEFGQIVGGRLAPTRNGPVSVPAYWPSSGQELVDLPKPSGEVGEALDVAADGTIVGTVGVDAYVWRPDGSHGRLPRPDGVPGNESVSAKRISGSWVIGTSGGGSVRWNLSTGAVERLDLEAHAVNDRGWLVGTDGDDVVVVIDGRTVRVPLDLDVPPNHPPYFLQLVSISRDGTTIGGTTWLRAPVSEQPRWWRCA